MPLRIVHEQKTRGGDEGIKHHGAHHQYEVCKRVGTTVEEISRVKNDSCESPANCKCDKRQTKPSLNVKSLLG